MADSEIFALLKKDIQAWNIWKKQYTSENLISIDLSNVALSMADLREVDLVAANLNAADLRGADLRGASLSSADLRGADLRRANLQGADFADARLNDANMSDANCHEAYLSGTNLRGVNLSNTDLSKANLVMSDLSYANLFNANLHGASLIDSNLDNAILSSCHINGAPEGNSSLKGTVQNDIIFTSVESAYEVVVDGLEVAQFLTFFLEERDVPAFTNTLIPNNAVLILGHFLPEQQPVLHLMRVALRHFSYLPIFFDSDQLKNTNVIKQVRLLASLSHFVLLDLTHFSPSLNELTDLFGDSSLPIQPIMKRTEENHNLWLDMQSSLRIFPSYYYHEYDDLLQKKVFNLIEHMIVSDKKNHKISDISLLNNVSSMSDLQPIITEKSKEEFIQDVKLIIAQQLRIRKESCLAMTEHLKKNGYEVTVHYDEETWVALDVTEVSNKTSYRFLYHPEHFDREDINNNGDLYYLFVRSVRSDGYKQLPQAFFKLCQSLASYVVPGSWLITQEQRTAPLRGYYLYPDGVYDAKNIKISSEKGQKVTSFFDLRHNPLTFWMDE